MLMCARGAKITAGSRWIGCASRSTGSPRNSPHAGALNKLAESKSGNFTQPMTTFPEKHWRRMAMRSGYCGNSWAAQADRHGRQRLPSPSRTPSEPRRMDRIAIVCDRPPAFRWPHRCDAHSKHLGTAHRRSGAVRMLLKGCHGRLPFPRMDAAL